MYSKILDTLFPYGAPSFIDETDWNIMHTTADLMGGSLRLTGESRKIILSTFDVSSDRAWYCEQTVRLFFSLLQERERACRQVEQFKDEEGSPARTAHTLFCLTRSQTTGVPPSWHTVTIGIYH